jgi:hypothetical protein
MWKIATLVVGPRLEKHYGAKALTYSVQVRAIHCARELHHYTYGYIQDG